MNFEGMTREELLQEALQCILLLTDEQLGRVLEQCEEEFDKEWKDMKITT
ncbi:hypothetical protein [uncultured Dysosmobacter sp.]|nr:hypothetical protein [uncultured Dysosmobacter sp.]